MAVKKCFWIGVCLYLLQLDSQAQSRKENKLEIGKSFPNFILSNVENYSKKQAAIKDFRGKWLILDFWNKYCGVCISAFPKYDMLQKEFEEKVQFVLVGIERYDVQNDRNDKANQIRSLFLKIRERFNLNLPCGFDSTFSKQYDIWTSPYIVIIDPEGVLRGITYKVTSDIILDFLSGKQVSLRGEEPIFSYDRKLPFLVKNNGGIDSDFLYRSLLSRWNGSMATSFRNRIYPSEHGRVDVLDFNLKNLYLLAYLGQTQIVVEDSIYGKFWPYPLLEMHDSTLFDGDEMAGINCYCYSMTVPVSKAKKNYLMQVMQRDLFNYFGYDVAIEVRKMPYWRLEASEQAKVKLRSKGEKPSLIQNLLKYKFSNIPMKIFIDNIPKHNLPIIDETGINGNIDITIDDGKLNFDFWKKDLEDNGLDLVRSEKEFEVLVIRDKNEDDFDK